MTNNPPEFPRGEILAQQYEVVDKLDTSPLGVTYRVKALDSGSYVQLTVLNPQLPGGERAIQDAVERATALDHPHLCRVLGMGEHGGHTFFTFEDFEGTSLRDLLVEYRVNNKAFAVQEAAQICMQILEALTAMHQAGQVYRALRPEYVLVNVRRTGPRQQNLVAEAKIVAPVMWSLVPTQTLAEDEFSRGESQYLAPELKGFDPVPTAKVDVYSAGVILYELLVGQAPVGTFQLPKARRQDLPDHVNNVVELALAYAPEDRYPSPQDFIQDIQRTFQDAALVDQAPARPLVSPVGWGIALSLVLVLGALLFSVRPDQGKQNEARDAAVRREVFEEVQATRPPPEVFRAMYDRHPKNMVYIPEGPYVAGRLHVETDNAFHSEPLAVKRRTKGYLIDVFEYPNLEGAKPEFGVTWHEAKALCEEQGKRLCTAEEWERACKGPRSQVYSYGDFYDPEHCGQGVEDPYPSGTRKLCRSEYGVFDLSGGFREWTSTPARSRVVVKGGLKSQPEKGNRCALIHDESSQLADQSIGFRCCRDPEAPPVDPVAAEEDEAR